MTKTTLYFTIHDLIDKIKVNINRLHDFNEFISHTIPTACIKALSYSIHISIQAIIVGLSHISLPYTTIPQIFFASFPLQ